MASLPRLAWFSPLNLPGEERSYPFTGAPRERSPLKSNRSEHGSGRGRIDLADRDITNCKSQGGQIDSNEEMSHGLNGYERSSTAAYWTDLVLSRVAKSFEVEVFHDRFIELPGFETSHYLAAAKCHEENPFDLFFYQLEDARATDFCRIHLGLIPGIVLFHDFLLSTDGPEPILNSSWEENLKLFFDSSRSFPDRANEYTRVKPYALRESLLAVRPLFSSAYFRAEFERIAAARLKLSSDTSVYIPHPVPEFLSIYNGPFKIALCGSPRVEHHAHVVLESAAKLGEVGIVWLLNPEDIPAAESLVDEFGLSGVEFVSPSTPKKWREILTRTSCAMHLHFSVFGQTGPYLETSLMSGLPVITTDFGASDFIPSTVCFKLSPGDREVAELVAVLGKIRAHKSTRSVGAEFAGEECTIEKVSAELVSTLLDSIPASRVILERWSELGKRARTSLLEQGIKDPLVAPISEVVGECFRELGWR